MPNTSQFTLVTDKYISGKVNVGLHVIEMCGCNNIKQFLAVSIQLTARCEGSLMIRFVSLTLEIA